MSDFDLQDVLDILSKAESVGIRISHIDGELNIKVPKNQKLDKDLFGELKRLKPQLLQYFQQHVEVPSSNGIPEISKYEGDDHAPLSFAQERIWLIDQLRGSADYHISSVVTLKGQLRRDYLEAACRTILERQQVLRTVFDEKEGVPNQVLRGVNSWSMQFVDAGTWDDNQIHAATDQLRQTPFDLRKDYMLRITLFRLSDKEHLLAVVIHHIASDGTSMQVLYRELQELYNAQVQSRSPELPEVSLQYVDYAAWQRKTVSDQQFEQSARYWKQHLQWFESLELPTDHSRQNNLQSRGKLVSLEIGPARFDKIKHFIGEQKGLTLFSFLLSAYYILLSRWSRQQDLVIGSPVVNRQHAELDQTVGLFLNTLAIRNKPAFDKPFQVFLDEVKQSTTQAFQHQNYQFESLLEELDFNREVMRNPLFDVFFNLINFKEAQNFSLEGLEIERPEEDEFASKFDLNLYAKAHEDTLYLNCVYNEGLFKHETMCYVFAQFDALLDQIIADPEQALGGYAIFEQNRIVKAKNTVAPDKTFKTWDIVTTSETLHGRFCQMAQQFPEKIAVQTVNESLTYQELDLWSSRIAHAILGLDVAKGSDEHVQLNPVALFFNHDLPMIAGIFGALKSGGTYVPIDPNFPQQRIEAILESSGTKVLLTTSTHQSRLKQVRYANKTQIVFVDNLPDDMASTCPELALNPEKPAYILYTSGSTGTPKGVIQSHRNALHFCQTYTEALKIDADDKLTGLSNYGFDASKMSIYGSLLNGATLYLYDLKNQGIEGFVEVLKREAITIYHSTPSVFRLVTDELAESDQVPAIRMVVLGGEALHTEEIGRYQQLFSDHCLLVNGLGPTESTVTLQYFVDKAANITGSYVPVGYPVAKTDVLVYRDEKELADVFEAGELVYQSDFLAPGYWQDTDKTNQSFFIREGKRYYRSGDRGRIRPDGIIEFLGREDAQVKIRGYRVELGEVENALLTHDQIKEVVVLSEENNGDTVLLAYYAGASTDEELLRSYLKDRLPDYMIPVRFTLLDKIPLNHNGKVDKRALPKVEVMSAVFEKPVNALEEQLVFLWANALKREEADLSVTADFFQLGGHSLVAVRLSAQIKKQLSKAVSIRDIFTYPTIRELAIFLSTAEASGSQEIAAIAEDSVRKPISYQQEGLYFVHQLKGSQAYHMPWVFDLEGELSVESLERAFRLVIERHQILGSVYEEEEGTVFQRYLGTEQFRIDFQPDISSTGIEDRITQISQEPFDLATDYMVRVSVLAVAEDKHVLVIVLHHIAFDAWSIASMIRELTEAYNSTQEQRPLRTPAPEIQYADYAAWQRKELTQDKLNNKLAYWKQQLQDHQQAEIVPDHNRERRGVASAGFYSEMTPALTTIKLNAYARKQESSLYMVLLAAYQVLLYKYSGSTDLCIGTPLAGRNHPSIVPLIGYFVNTLPIRASLDGLMSFDALLKQVKRLTFEAQENEEVPFDQIVNELGVGRSKEENPLFNLTFALQKKADGVENLEWSGGLQFNRRSSKPSKAKYDLSLNILEKGEELQLNMTYRADLYEASTIQRLLKHYQRILESIIDHSDVLIQDIQLLDDREKKELMGFNRMSSIESDHASIVAAFAQQVQWTPEATALVFQEEKITYQELDESTDRVAAILIEEGVKPESIVAICLEKGTQMMIAILATLKAGAAYMPLDPKYPKDRMAYMINDAKPVLCLTADSHQKQLAGQVPILLMEELTSEPASSQMPVFPALASNNLAYVLYTSGSTGRPKGVLVEHGNVISLIDHADYANPASDDVLLSTGSPTFDATTFEYWTMLLRGGTLILAEERALLDIARLKELIVQHRVNKMWFTAGWFNQLVDEDISIFDTLECVLAGGEKLSENHVYKLKTERPDLKIINGYGPTENTTFSVTHDIRLTDHQTTIPIGTPIVNRPAYVLDREGNFSPIGGQGELYLGGVGLARGYLNNKVLTDEKFIIHPESQERLYKTGDLARWLPNGLVDYLGRRDDQVKIRGFRIELEEITRVLLQQEGIAQGVVLVKEDGKGDKQLVAYYVSEGNVSDEEIKDHLKGYLPEYMIPSRLVLLDRMPLTLNGKVDKKALLGIELSKETSDSAPKSALEKQIIEIWQEILEVENIGLEDDFFEIGGHSLIATRVVAAIRKKLAVEIGIGDLFDYPTVASLVKHLDPDHGTEKMPIRAVRPLPSRIPLSFAQERLLIIHKLKGSLEYHMPWVFGLKGELDINLLQKAVIQALDRHDSLRTIIQEEGEEIWQSFKSAGDWKLQVVKAEEVQKTGGKEAFIEGFVKTPFDLSKDYMFRAALIEEQPDHHVLVVVIHHIAFDGWSISILVDELTRIYRALSSGLSVDLPDLPVSYADYAIWQRNVLEGGELADKLTYWKSNLLGVESLNLSTDYPRSKHVSGAVCSGDLDQATLERLKSISHENGATLFMTLLAAFKVLLFRYSGQNDLCVGTPIAGRQYAELEGLTGFFVNTLPIRTQTRSEWSFEKQLQELKQITLAAYEHQEVPFEKIVEALDLPRDLDQNALFQVMFSLQNMPASGSLDFGNGLQLQRESLKRDRAKFDLHMEASETDEGLFLSLSYRSDLFREATAELMMQHFMNLLNAIAADPKAVIRDYDILEAAEHQLLVQELSNGPESAFTLPTVLDAIASRVAKSPKKVAVSDGKSTFTYQELQDLSDRVAKHLIASGSVENGAIVPLILEKDPYLIVAILGVMKAGAAYLPITPSAPVLRMEMIMEDAMAKTVITNEAFSLDERFQDIKHHAIESLVQDDQPTDHTLPQIKAEDLAYVFYTSGSTGKPKGVMIEHGSLVNLNQHILETLPISSEERILQFSDFTFDASVEQIFIALTSGSSLILLPDEIRQDPHLVEQFLEEQAITHLHATPSFLKTLQPGTYTGLRRVVSGGEMCDTALARKWAPFVPFINSYGPTETTVTVTQYTYDESVDSLTLPIGKAFSNTQLFILDGDLRPVPVGVVGELYIGGAQVGRGYLNNEALTRERYIDSPFGETGQKLYRTGDLSKWLPDGNVMVIGRNDDQVKIRGVRMELGEITEAARSHPHVGEATVLTSEISGEIHLVAYYSASEGIEDADFRLHMQSILPSHMVPSFYVHFEQLPYTRNGKIDRKSLRSINPVTRIAVVPPVTSTEVKLVDIWSEVLKIEPSALSVTKSFFEMGGHSLRATFMINKVNKRFAVQVPLREVFRRQDIRSLANYIDEAERQVLHHITPAPEKSAYRLSSAQSRMYFLYQLDTQSLAYNMPTLIRLKGSLDLPQLERAVDQLIARHESLRTAFRVQDDEVVQVILPHGSIEVAYYQSNATSLSAITRRFVQPFDLEKAPLIRVGVVAITDDPDDWLLMLDVHHIISDFVTMQILYKDIISFYNGLDLSPIQITYKDFAEWQLEDIYQNSIDRQKAYWLDRFAEDLSPLDLPVDFPRPPVKQYDGADYRVYLEKEQADQLKSISQKMGSTMFMTVLSIYNVLLSKLGNCEDIVVGSPVAGRQHIDMEGVVGMFVNTLPLRNYPSGDKTFRGFLEEVKRSTLDGLDNQQFQYEELVDSLGLLRDAGRNPIFDVVFTYQNHREDLISIDNLEANPFRNEHITSKFDLILAASENEDRIQLNFTYSTVLFEEATIRRFAEYFLRVTDSVIEDLEVKLSEIEVVSEPEKQVLLNTFNNTKKTYPIDRSYLALYDEVMPIHSGNTVLVAEGKQITYQELNEKANAFAYMLVSTGIKPGDRVGFMSGQNPEMLVGLLGILKAGGVFVPIDPAYPADRVAYMLEDSEARLFLKTPGLSVEVTTDKKQLEMDDWESLSTTSESPKVGISADDLAYIIYTSGSTGQPKGVMVQHRSLVNLCYWHNEAFAVTSKDRATKYAGFGFDASVWEVFPYLLKGASIHMVEPAIRFDASKINDYFNENGISIAFLPTQLCEQFVQYDNTSLRVLLTGGDELKLQKATTYQFYNNYGPTENTVVTTSQLMPDPAEGQRISIGGPIANNELYVLDKDDHLCPIGVVGELCVGGKGLAKGYYNKPQLTASKFVENPFEAGERIYRTGDLVKWTAEGTLEFRGRQDAQVKMRGYRIELGEIESQINQFEGIIESVVIVVQRSAAKMLVAYYAAKIPVELDELKTHLMNSLPEFMIPSRFMRIDELPKTPNGKINRKGLPEFEIEEEAYTAPVNEIEAKLVDIWSNILKLDPEEIGTQASFFELGGHSLLATVLINKIYQELDVELPLRQIFEKQRITSLADYIITVKQLQDDDADNEFSASEMTI